MSLSLYAHSSMLNTFWLELWNHCLLTLKPVTVLVSINITFASSLAAVMTEWMLTFSWKNEISICSVSIYVKRLAKTYFAFTMNMALNCIKKVLTYTKSDGYYGLGHIKNKNKNKNPTNQKTPNLITEEQLNF